MSYWHFSSHGTFDWDDPRASGLVLADEKRLTVADLFDAEGLRGPRLVVLSACETGLYDVAVAPNEFIGLPTAFLQLGAQGVLATLWPVDDLSTALLVAKFYDLHLGGGVLSPAAALREAQDWLRRTTGEGYLKYARDAVRDGRLTPSALQRLQETIGESKVAPFAHPYHWRLHADRPLSGCLWAARVGKRVGPRAGGDGVDTGHGSVPRDAQARLEGLVGVGQVAARR